MKNIKIYYSTDIHGYIFPTNYVKKEIQDLGLLKFSSIINKDANTLVIDGGDTIQGSPLTSYLVKNKSKWTNNPIAEVFNQLGYDYITLGNHDFNYGEDYLVNYLKTLEAKTLCANVKYSKDQTLILPYDIKTLENGLKVGIIGATTSHINVWEQKRNIEFFDITDPYTSIKMTLEKIKPDVDITIVVYHGGFERDIDTGVLKPNQSGENQAYRIASELDIDLLLTGHQHVKINEHMINGTYIVQTPANATELCEIMISINEEIKITSRFLLPTDIKQGFIKPPLKQLGEEIENWLDQPIGYLSKPIPPTTHLDLAINGSFQSTFLNKIQLEVSLADISATSPAHDIHGFNQIISIRNIVSTYIYPNTLVVLEITGKILKLALERNAEYLDLKEGNIVVNDYGIPHYNYDIFMGIEYSINLTKEIHNRIENIKFKGNVVKDTDTFTIILNNYRASGTGGYEFYQNAKIVKEILIDIQELIIDYILQHPQIDIVIDNNFKIID